jgi:hypothetical protein
MEIMEVDLMREPWESGCPELSFDIQKPLCYSMNFKRKE